MGLLICSNLYLCRAWTVALLLRCSWCWLCWRRFRPEARFQTPLRSPETLYSLICERCGQEEALRRHKDTHQASNILNTNDKNLSGTTNLLLDKYLTLSNWNVKKFNVERKFFFTQQWFHILNSNIYLFTGER